MAVPARRKSSTRIKKGRGPKSWSFYQKVINQPLVKCTSCQKIKMLHHVCPHCSVYRANSNSQRKKKESKRKAKSSSVDIRS